MLEKQHINIFIKHAGKVYIKLLLPVFSHQSFRAVLNFLHNQPSCTLSLKFILFRDKESFIKFIKRHFCNYHNKNFKIYLSIFKINSDKSVNAQCDFNLYIKNVWKCKSKKNNT